MTLYLNNECCQLTFVNPQLCGSYSLREVSLLVGNVRSGQNGMYTCSISVCVCVCV